MLHGREDFVDHRAAPRKMRRVWINADSPPLMNVLGEPIAESTVVRYAPYRALPCRSRAQRRDLDLGIKLQPDISRQLDDYRQRQ